jgi:hypothetical protein
MFFSFVGFTFFSPFLSFLTCRPIFKGEVKLAPPAETPDVDRSGKKKKKKKSKEINEENSLNKVTAAAEAKSAGDLPVTASSECSSVVIECDDVPVVQPKSSPTPAPQLGFPGFASPTVSTPKLSQKSHTAVFLKKALSKSVTPKMKKKAASSVDEVVRPASEPKPKRVNFVLTRNKSQVTVFDNYLFSLLNSD